MIASLYQSGSEWVRPGCAMDVLCSSVTPANVHVEWSRYVPLCNTASVVSLQPALDDFTLDDCVSSPYAVRNYTVSEQLGGLEGLLRLRARLHQAGIGLILDFVPNHTACDHPWVHDSPQYYVQGS